MISTRELSPEMLDLLQSCLTIAEDYRDNHHINGGATREELYETIETLTEIMKENQTSELTTTNCI